MFYNAAVVIIALRSEEFSSMRIVVLFRSIHFWKKEKGRRVGREGQGGEGRLEEEKEKEEKGRKKGECREERKEEDLIFVGHRTQSAVFTCIQNKMSGKDALQRIYDGTSARN